MLIILNGGCECALLHPLLSLLPLEKEGCREMSVGHSCYSCEVLPHLQGGKGAGEQESLPWLWGSGMNFTPAAPPEAAWLPS